MIPPPPVDLELERLVTRNRIISFCHEEAVLKKIFGCFREDVRNFKELYERRLTEINDELEWERQNGSPAGVKWAHGLMKEREELSNNPPFVWLAELYGNAVRSYLESTEQKLGGARGGKS